MKDLRKFYINGQWVQPLQAQDLAVENPATEKSLAIISLGAAGDVDLAVAAAKAKLFTLNGCRTLFITSINSGAAVPYPILKPAKPYAFEKLLEIIRFLKSLSHSNESDFKLSSRYSS